MSLSQPIYKLKLQAKILHKKSNSKLVHALNQIANNEGYSSWSLLTEKNNLNNIKTHKDILNSFNSGDFVLIAARPGMHKTTFCLKLLVEAIKLKKRSCFYSLEGSLKSMASKLATVDKKLGLNNDFLTFDLSNDISSNYIIEHSKNSSHQFNYIAIDYLQLLDQKRSNPSIEKQLNHLKLFSKKENKIILFISQIDRHFDDNAYNFPRLEDLRLPNPVDLKLFNKILFIHNKKLKMMRPKVIDLKLQ